MSTFIRLQLVALACVLLVGCGNEAPAPASNAGGGAASSGANSPASAPATKFKTATAPASPCDWIPAADVAAVVGPLTGSPTRVRAADSPVPYDQGNACLYTLVQEPKIGKGTVTVQVELNDGVIAEDVAGSMFGRFAREVGQGGKVNKPAVPEGWDSVTRMGYMFMGRVGHIGVHVATESMDVSFDKLAALAAVVRDRVPDQPFAMPLDPLLAKLGAANRGSGQATASHDPCSLLTRADAEAVLGPLAADPYRSATDSPLLDEAGGSCTYFTGRHRALVITPEWDSGKMIFNMGKGIGGLVGQVSGSNTGAAVTETGPWERAAIDPSGALMFLKGDRALRIHFRTSSADRAGALRLAATAVNKL